MGQVHCYKDIKTICNIIYKTKISISPCPYEHKSATKSPEAYNKSNNYADIETSTYESFLIILHSSTPPMAGSWEDSSSLHFFERGDPQSSGLPVHEEASKFWSWVVNGIFPDRLLLDKSNTPRWPDWEKLSGILPLSFLLDKSSEFNKVNSPIFAGICPVRVFDERFKEINPVRQVIFSGISPDILLLEKSMHFTRPRVFLYNVSVSFPEQQYLVSVIE